ncbi:serine/threonine-protein kinase [Clostridium moniliforme]|uniref:non-specific serine/threonine protein kinase n=1 Tax=Clostridium moniliforme TaxID=39489 RepID=A0ABS4EX35_9CLOT|nr:Stk1 family PASTA domain-containing Ser/Thr kinase [Clostridium moniliforme]MBP1888560.1 serine/threonine-protein kinase [Clostridium moniliforme]
MNGEILGDRYELIEKVGEGGMAIVYKARDNKLNRYVAVKILKDEYSDNEEIVNKFKKEATAIAKLSDNNIVNVLDVGTQDETNYIVMEFVSGKTLKEVIGEFGKVNYETAIAIALQVAKALDCAHRNDIIHRDIKPQNILVTENGLVKVTDFGIAKSSDSATLTNTSTILGSAHYFSPEQARGGFINNRTDIYSLGVVIYEMLTGKVPFEADSPVTIALKHLQEEVVQPKNINSKIPDSLNEVVLKCMEKDADKRYQDVKDLISDLEKIKEDPNAKIGEGKNKETNENDVTAQHTIIMSPVKEPIITKDDNEDLDDGDLAEDDDYYDDDYYDDDYYDDAEEEDSAKKKKSRKGKKNLKGIIIGVVSVVVIALLGFGAYSLFGNSKESKKVKVPNFVGMTMDEAKKEADSVGLKVTKAKEVKSDEKKGTIIESNPKAGESVDEGTTVEVTVSGGEKVKLPNLAEDDLNDAKAKLEALGITNINIDEEYSDSISKGQVISQSPNSGEEVSKDTTVTLVVSKGQKVTNVTVPKVIGMSVNDAKSTLSNAGLSVTVESKKTTDKDSDGKVLDQKASAGTTVNKGSNITIIVGNYEEPKKDTITVAPVTGLSQDVAINKLSGLNVNVITQDTDDKSLDGKVISQSLQAGAKVDQNTSITIKVGKYKAPDNENSGNNEDPKGHKKE